MVRLRKVRLEQGLTLMRLGFIANVNPPRISAAENGRGHELAPAWRRRLAAALGLDPETLLDEVPDAQGDTE